MQEFLAVANTHWQLLFELTLQHLWISNIAILLAIFIGISIGIFLSIFTPLKGPILVLVKMLYTIPSIAMFGFLLPFFDVGNQTAIIALVIYALLPMIMNTVTGIENIPKHITDCAKAMGSSRRQILFKIELPLALPVILSGIRTMVVMTIALTGIATFIGAGGLGVMIYRGITTNQIYLTLLGSIAVALLAFAVDGFLRLLEWQLTKRRSLLPKKLFISLSLMFVIIITGLISLTQMRASSDVNIATKPMTEQYILGHILKLLIEDNTSLKVKLSQGIGGGTSNIHPAMVDQQFDIYPEYTGTAWNAVLGEKSNYQSVLFDKLKKQYEQSFNLTWKGLYGFNNTYGIAIKKEIADKYQIKTLSDLAIYAPELKFAAEYDFFERPDGYNALKETYGIYFEEMIDMDIGLKYQALNQGKVDVINVFTTDGLLSQSDVVILDDNKQLYPAYEAGNIINQSLLEEHPQIEPVLNKLNGLITDKEMATLNYEVEVLKKSPENVAKEFLQSKGIY
ncbi:ABC transporter permease/substrate-binding protein [Thorsellia kenyensis]|uniref:Glycine betaine ABC transporter substrate-binding protein n=1 Tax=Thorsellia kenyensis TaxID=1549888 RepID=A0ABV6CAW1_9GAMM